MLGLYVHVPFCAQKCPYCDFYSVPWRIIKEDAYLQAVCKDMQSYAKRRLPADTLYFGGGTPSLIQPKTIAAIIQTARECFALTKDAEITLECNPCTVTAERAAAWANAGINRVSLGMQSANPAELKLLGRRHSPNMVSRAVTFLRNVGIDNISLDVMMALPHQTEAELLYTIDFAASLAVQHISAYLLQIESGTPLAESDEIMFCPDDDAAAQMYLAAVERLQQHGYRQYEISNFAKPGYQSRHNNKYWYSVDYLGFGPAAHSCFAGKRFCYPPDLDSYLQGLAPVYDADQPDATEYAMLRLRLTEGLSLTEYADRGGDIHALQKRAAKYRSASLVTVNEERISLTPRGFLLSNALIADLLL